MAYSRWNHLGISFQSKPHNFSAGLRHLIRHHIPVNVQRGLDVAVPHEFLLHSDGRPHSIKP